MQMIQGQTAELVAYSDDYYEFVYEVKKNALEVDKLGFKCRL